MPYTLRGLLNLWANFKFAAKNICFLIHSCNLFCFLLGSGIKNIFHLVSPPHLPLQTEVKLTCVLSKVSGGCVFAACVFFPLISHLPDRCPVLPGS